ncbi:MAG: 50S ribosomal protein L37e [Candidatus Micrarchaeota archaeon]|nr:50S ribosomal protein L37e [Candidatus Micrarchaeota archaeon]
MSKGTPSFGKHNKITHIVCRRCGRHSYHIRKKRCAACGYPDSKLRSYNWSWKGLKKERKK